MRLKSSCKDMPVEQEFHYLIFFFKILGFYPYSPKPLYNILFISITLFRLITEFAFFALINVRGIEFGASVEKASSWSLYFYMTFAVGVCLAQSLMCRNVMTSFYRNLNDLHSVYFIVGSRGSVHKRTNVVFTIIILVITICGFLLARDDLFRSLHTHLNVIYDWTCLMKGVQFVFHAHILNMELLYINEQLTRILVAQKERFLNGQIYILKQAYTKVLYLSKNVNQSFGISLLFIILCMFGKIVLVLYRSALLILNGHGHLLTLGKFQIPHWTEFTCIHFR